jgi:hypothetical protein
MTTTRSVTSYRSLRAAPSRLELADVRATLAKPGCPICRYADDATRRYFTWFSIENYSSPPTLAWLRHSRGMCPAHTRRLVSQENADAQLTTVYEYVLPAAAGYLTGPPADTRSCPACDSRDSAVRESLGQLIRALTEPEIQRLYGQSEGLCAIHLRLALPAAPTAVLARAAVHHLATDPPPLQAIAGTDDDAERRTRLRALLPSEGLPETGANHTVERVATRLVVDACPLCLAEGQAERRYLQWLCIEYAEGGPDALRSEPGSFCPGHLHDLAAMDRAVAAWAASRDRDRLRQRMARLGRLLPTGPPPNLWQRLRGNGTATLSDQRSDRPGQPVTSRSAQVDAARLAVEPDQCMVCKAVADTVRGETELLYAALARPSLTRRFEDSHGLCLRHALDADTHQSTGQLARTVAAAHASMLIAELREAGRKRAWQARHEEPGPEASAWLRTAGLLDGRVFLGGPATTVAVS